MRIAVAALLLAGGLTATSLAFADSVTTTTGAGGTTIVNSKPCRVVTRHDGGRDTNSTTITSGSNGLSGSTTITQGSGAGSSVAVGSSSAADGHTTSSAGSDCVIYKNEPKK